MSHNVYAIPPIRHREIEECKFHPEMDTRYLFSSITKHKGFSTKKTNAKAFALEITLRQLVIETISLRFQMDPYVVMLPT